MPTRHQRRNCPYEGSLTMIGSAGTYDTVNGSDCRVESTVNALHSLEEFASKRSLRSVQSLTTLGTLFQ